MGWLMRLFSPSRSVENEVLKRLPQTVLFEFRAEFDDRNNPVIFIMAPKYEGLISEAGTFEQAVANACDAILTYFNVPREYAKLIEYEVQEVTEPASADGLRKITLHRHDPVRA
jgi:hypothetical protein